MKNKVFQILMVALLAVLTVPAFAQYDNVPSYFYVGDTLDGTTTSFNFEESKPLLDDYECYLQVRAINVSGTTDVDCKLQFTNYASTDIFTDVDSTMAANTNAINYAFTLSGTSTVLVKFDAKYLRWNLNAARQGGTTIVQVARLYRKKKS